VPKRLLPVPHHKQRSSSDCLAACAAMLLDFAGRPIAYHRLLKLLDITQFGTPARRITNLARSDLHVTYTQGSLTELETLIEYGTPIIVSVRTEDLPCWSFNTDHTVVIVGFVEQSVYVNDPYFENAPQTISRDDFYLAWIAFDHYYATISLR